MHRILLVEDDPVLNSNISKALASEGMEVEAVFDGALAVRLLQKMEFDCVILDINLPGRNGYEVCKELRTFNALTPVLMLTVFDELEDKVKGYNAGADDYLTKPFYTRELLLRVHSLIKRTEMGKATEPENQLLSVSDITVDHANKKVTRQGAEIQLTPREYQIFVRLLEANGELVSKQELIKEIWGSLFNANTNTIEVYINFLRNKVDKPFGKESIKTKIGFGYYFEDV